MLSSVCLFFALLHWQPVEMDSWEIHVELQIGGGGKIGADGMGLWYVAEPKQEGPAMGNKDYFKGVGVIFDSFDNDGQVRGSLQK